MTHPPYPCPECGEITFHLIPGPLPFTLHFRCDCCLSVFTPTQITIRHRPGEPTRDAMRRRAASPGDATKQGH